MTQATCKSLMSNEDISSMDVKNSGNNHIQMPQVWYILIDGSASEIGICPTLHGYGGKTATKKSYQKNCAPEGIINLKP